MTRPSAPARVGLRPARDAAEWRGLEGLRGATFLHSWDWLSWVAPLIGHRFVPLVVDSATEGAIGIAPVLLQRRGPVAAVGYVPFEYLGPVVPAAYAAATIAELWRWCRRHLVVTAKLQAHSGGVAAADFRAAGYRTLVTPTYSVPLADRTAEQVLTGTHLARTLRRAERAGVVVRESTAEELCDVLPRVHEEALGHHVPHIAALARALAERPEGFRTGCRTALLGDRPIGVCVAVGPAVAGGAGVTGGMEAIGWLGAVSREHQRTQANSAVIWAVIEWARTAGMPGLDLLGAPDPGIAAFKARIAAPTPGQVTAIRSGPGWAPVSSLAVARLR